MTCIVAKLLIAILYVRLVITLLLLSHQGPNEFGINFIRYSSLLVGSLSLGSRLLLI